MLSVSIPQPFERLYFAPCPVAAAAKWVIWCAQSKNWLIAIPNA
jgi:hypothetical protein